MVTSIKLLDAEYYFNEKLIENNIQETITQQGCVSEPNLLLSINIYNTVVAVLKVHALVSYKHFTWLKVFLASPQILIHGKILIYGFQGLPYSANAW